MSSDTVKEATSSKKDKNINNNGFDQIGGISTSASTPSLTSISTSTSTSTSYYITGFGPFGGVDENPTSTIIDSLKELQKNHNNHNHNGDNEKQDGSISDIDIDSGGNDLHLLLSKIQYLNIVKVAAYSAKQEVETIISLIRQRKCDRDRDHGHDRTPQTHTRDHAIILHLGVNHNLSMKTIPTIQLEQNAFNQAHFRIPDEDGYQPVKELIVNHINVNIDVDVEKVDMKANENERVDNEQKRGTSTKGGSSTKGDRDQNRDRLSTDLNAKRIKGYLTDKHKLHADTGDKNQYEVALSGNAGRFVCNYIIIRVCIRSINSTRNRKHNNNNVKGCRYIPCLCMCRPSMQFRKMRKWSLCCI